MLTLVGEQVECLWDEVLPIEVRELPDDLVRLDRVLSDSLLLSPIAQAWAPSARDRGRPSISMATFVRLMVVKQRTGWGYETVIAHDWASAETKWDRFDFTRPGSLYFRASGGLGWGMPAAIGLQLGDPSRRVLAILGDGQCTTPSAHYGPRRSTRSRSSSSSPGIPSTPR
jgi:hypothetical protein